VYVKEMDRLDQSNKRFRGPLDGVGRKKRCQVKQRGVQVTVSSYEQGKKKKL